MHEILTIPIINITINSYALCLIASFIIGAIWSGYRARSGGLDPNVVPDMAFWIFIFALLGARVFMLLYKINRQNIALFDLKNVLQLTLQGGMVAYGGIVFAVATAVVYAITKRVNLLSYLNVFALPFAFGIGLVRIGCFFNGCCYGKECHTALGVTFPAGSPGGIYQVNNNIQALFPSQLLESFLGFVILAVLLFSEKAFMSKKYSFFLSFSLYAISRFIVDFTRYYPEKDKFMSLTNNQWVCVSIFFLGIISIISMFYTQKKAEAKLYCLFCITGVGFCLWLPVFSLEAEYDFWCFVSQQSGW